MNKAKEKGHYVAHLSPPNHPGFPDILLMWDDFCLMIEVKDLSKIGPKQKMSVLFTDAQPPFFMKMVNAKCYIRVAGYLNNKIYSFEVENQKMIDDLFLLGRDEYLGAYGLIAQNIEELLP